jgi:rubrerythrin
VGKGHQVTPVVAERKDAPLRLAPETLAAGINKNLLRERGKQSMLSKIPISLESVKTEDLDREILRTGIIAELDAINLYEQMAAVAKSNDIKKTLRDIAKEEKTHVGEFLTLLLGKDREQGVELEKGKEEIEELIGK